MRTMSERRHAADALAVFMFKDVAPQVVLFNSATKNFFLQAGDDTPFCFVFPEEIVYFCLPFVFLHSA